MASNSGRSRRFLVQKDNGEFWNMNFTPTGVSWVPAGGGFDQSPVRLSGPRLPSMGFDPVGALTGLVDAAASIGMWWETRQQRLLNDAVHEESRRIPWLADMLGRWGEAHARHDHLDLQVSEYLAREAREAMDELMANKKTSIPQSMLYDLETIIETHRRFRQLFLAQFEEAAKDPEVALEDKVRQALPGSKLDLDFIRALAQDPGIEWSSKVRAKSNKGFDQELSAVFRHSEVFLSRLFPGTEVEIRKPEAAPKSSFFSHVLELVAGALPRQRPDDIKPDMWERRDTFRELSLLSAEVARGKALHTAWLATNAAIRESLGEELTVRVGPKSLTVELEPDALTVLPSSASPSALDAPAGSK